MLFGGLHDYGSIINGNEQAEEGRRTLSYLNKFPSRIHVSRRLQRRMTVNDDDAFRSTPTPRFFYTADMHL